MACRILCVVRSHVFAVIAAVLAILVFGAACGLPGSLLTAIGRDFGTSLDVTGSLLPITFAGSAISVIIAGYLADRFGKRLLFLIISAGLAFIYIAMSMAPSFLLVALGCLLAGALGGALESLCSAIIADVDPSRVNRNMNLLQVTFNVGAVAMLLVASRMVNGDGGDINWRGTYLVLAISCAAIWVVALPMRVPPPPPAAPINFIRAFAMVKDTALLMLAVAIALYVGSEMSLAWWISSLMEKHHGYAPTHAAMGAMLFWLAMGVGRLVSSCLCRWYSGLKVLRWHIAGGLLAYLVLLLPLGEWRLWVGVALAGFTFSGTWPLIVSLGSARYRSYSGTVVALLVASGAIGGLCFTGLPGLILKHGGSRVEPLCIGAMACLFLLLGVAVWQYERLERTTPQPASVPDSLPGG